MHFHSSSSIPSVLPSSDPALVECLQCCSDLVLDQIGYHYWLDSVDETLIRALVQSVLKPQLAGALPLSVPRPDLVAQDDIEQMIA